MGIFATRGSFAPPQPIVSEANLVPAMLLVDGVWSAQITILHCLTCVWLAPTITRNNIEHGIIDTNNSSFTNEDLWPKMDLSLNLVSPAFEKDVKPLLINDKQGERNR